MNLFVAGAKLLDDKGRYITMYNYSFDTQSIRPVDYRSEADLMITDDDLRSKIIWKGACICETCLNITKKLIQQGMLFPPPSKDQFDNELPDAMMRIIKDWSFETEWKREKREFNNVYAILKASTFGFLGIKKLGKEVDLANNILKELEQNQDWTNQDVLQSLILAKNTNTNLLRESESEFARRLCYCINKLKSLGVTLPAENMISEFPSPTLPETNPLRCNGGLS